MPRTFEPKLFSVLREGYGREQLTRDLAAGVVVGIVALPLAIAFAIASGVKPEQGLATAVVAGLLISVLSGSRVQIGGPTGAFIVIVSGIVARYGYDGLALATLIAGVLLVLMGLARLGAVIQFLPFPLTVGFTSAIALIIFGTQIRDFLGLAIGAVPAEFVAQWATYARHFGAVNPWAAGVGAGSLGILIFWPKVSHRVPAPLVALVAATVAVSLFDLPVETIGSRFGEVPSRLPAPRLPAVDFARARELVSPAIAIALLAAIESLLSAVVADGMTGRRHRSNAELIAQGIANIASPLFGGIPATGAIARTATNVKNGGRTPIAGMVHAVTLLAILLIAGRWAGLIPLAALAAILMVVAYNMSEWRLFLRLFRSPKSDVTVLLTTFLLTLLVDLTAAIQAGVVLSALLFMRRMSAVSEAGFVTRALGDEEGEEVTPDLRRREVPAGIEVFQIQGPFFFGATSTFKDALQRIEKPPKVLILRMRLVPAVDATALQALEDVVAKARREGTALLLSGLQPQPRAALERAGLLARIGEDRVLPDVRAALARAQAIVAGESAGAAG